MPRPGNIILLIFAFFALTGCVRPESAKTADIDPSGWRVDDTVRIGIDNADTLSRHRLTLLFRFDETFVTRNIPLTIRVTTPDSLWYEEGFTAVPGDPVRANNDFYETTAPYRRDVILTHTGRYAFEIVNAGREIHGLWGLGMIIE